MGATSTLFINEFASTTGAMVTDNYGFFIILIALFLGLTVFGLIARAIITATKKATRF